MERMTAVQLRQMQSGAGTKRVQGARRTERDGFAFDSKREADRWTELSLMLRAGEIAALERQVSIDLCGRDGPILTPTGRRMRYVADFSYVDQRTGQRVIEDAKGWATEVYRIKRAILAAQGVEVREV